ncbi:hypothetical protein IWT25_01704 [Secundilactobacillus pentosiphilus]|uniref:Surface layer protein A domain-containing protein n=1 Tax=Secundilactobacillus pentosiphilus TaxID=1714682 RepID=A0A1Z5IX38_9LACO|nr:hypothetical protein [Secundilactobacillus pentosiphilus]GAX06360.1 hypothetical protein IWT25_01704 [Secundilactobacillus pentosiphilus]
MNFLGKTAILGLSVTCLGAFSGTQTAQASTKVQYKNLKATQYTVVKGSKGYLYKDATLKHKLHSVKNYSKVKFVVSKEAIMRKANGKKAVYYRVKSGKVTGWIWNGYLAKVSVKKPTRTQNTVQQQQITNLQQQVNDLKNQLTSHFTTSNSTSTSSDNSALQGQINTLQDQLKNLQNRTSVSNSGNDSNKDALSNPWSGTSGNYYVFSTSPSFSIYKDNQVANDLANNKGIDLSRVATNYKVTDYTIKLYADNRINNMYPCEYNGTKGYVSASDVTLINVDDATPQAFQIGYASLGGITYQSNVAPTDSKLGASISSDGADWQQYNHDGYTDYELQDGKWVKEGTKAWGSTGISWEDN